MSTQEIARIHKFFKEFVFGFMFHDVEAAIIGKANFLAALGLMEYTEILGGLVTGKLRETKPGIPQQNFKAFLPYLGDPYIKLDQDIDLYHRVRCGLAHEYFIKGSATIYMFSDIPIPCGIDYQKERDWVRFVVRKYFDDFKAAVETYHGQLVYEKNKDLIEAFGLVGI